MDTDTPGPETLKMAEALRSAVKAGAISDHHAAGHLMNTCGVDLRTAAALMAGRQTAGTVTPAGQAAPWHRAVADAAEDETPASAEEAVRDELVNLWTDLDHAVSYAYNGRWSMGCDNITGRIIRLSRVAGAIPWQQVPYPLLLSGTYHGILADAGIEHAEPGEDDLRKMQAWIDGQRAAVRR